MPFNKFRSTPYPPRLWSLIGYPGSGKSSFAAQMRAPLLPIDADHRFGEVVGLVPGGREVVFELSDVPTDNVDPDRIAALLNENMPGSGVATIVVDSLTAIITPIVVQAMVDKEQGREKNLLAGFRDKALAMRQLQDGVSKWGTDVLWIYHLNDARDAQGKELTKATVSQTELARLTRSINMQLQIVQDGQNGKGRRGVKIVWARRGRSGVTLWDDTGFWKGMPELVEATAYDGLSQAEQDRIEHSAPDVFPNIETALAWAMEHKAFEAIAHARNAYDKLKREQSPKTAREMTQLWVADVQGRLMAKATEGSEA